MVTLELTTEQANALMALVVETCTHREKFELTDEEINVISNIDFEPLICM